MKYKLKAKALDDLDAARSYIMDAIIHMTEAKGKSLFYAKQGVILIGCTIISTEHIIYVHHFL